MGKNQYVVPRKDGWGVRGEDNIKCTSLHPTQRGAIEAEISIAKNQKSELFILGRNGKIRERNSYGGDPFPPRG